MSILIGFTCLLLAVFLLAVPTPRKQPNRFLAIFLILTAIELSGWLWIDASNYNSWLNGIRMALGRLQMPVFLGFFISSCYSDFKLKWRDLWHLLPFAAMLLCLLPGSQFFLSPDTGANIAVPVTNSEIDADAAISHIQYYIYIAWIIGVLWQFRSRFREHYSGAHSEVLKWLGQLAGASLFAHTIVLLRDILRMSPVPDGVIFALQVFSPLLTLAITTWIALKSLIQPHLFRDVDRKLINMPPKDGITGNSETHQSRNLQKLLSFVETQHPYLNPDISLAKLSGQLAMTPRELSELINQSIGEHFFDFINGYRIKKAQNLLTSSPRCSVLEILYTVGFNSKSSFNTAFKKHTGMTPSHYRRQHKSGGARV